MDVCSSLAVLHLKAHHPKALWGRIRSIGTNGGIAGMSHDRRLANPPAAIAVLRFDSRYPHYGVVDYLAAAMAALISDSWYRQYGAVDWTMLELALSHS